jgi:CrcB protein
MTAAAPLDPDLDPLRLSTISLVFLGGVAGGLARYAVTQAWRAPTAGFPWATLAVNLSGAAALAVLVVTLLRRWPGLTWARPLLGTGVLGAWTTFSAIAVATDELIAHGRPGIGIAYLLASIVGGVVAAALGARTARRFVSAPRDTAC